MPLSFGLVGLNTVSDVVPVAVVASAVALVPLLLIIFLLRFNLVFSLEVFPGITISLLLAISLIWLYPLFCFYG